MGDRLEKTDVAQSHHDRVTGEIPIMLGGRPVLVDPAEPSVRAINSAVDMFKTYEVDGFMVGPAVETYTGPELLDKCRRCGRSSRIGGHEETILLRDPGFEHYICDDRWDP